MFASSLITTGEYWSRVPFFFIEKSSDLCIIFFSSRYVVVVVYYISNIFVDTFLLLMYFPSTRYDPVEIYGEAYIEFIADVPDPKKVPYSILDNVENTYNELGKAYRGITNGIIKHSLLVSVLLIGDSL